eukprot:m.145294 g.145294  ORF g.145294 m.145294 type:complete len:68 (+) comp14943_c1_seq1:2633-2836(+)
MSSDANCLKEESGHLLWAHLETLVFQTICRLGQDQEHIALMISTLRILHLIDAVAHENLSVITRIKL